MPHALLLAALLAGAAPADDLAGRYRLTGEADVASELVLQADGRFRYFLSAGALDEQAAGRWARAGARVTLTTEPEPVPPSFSPAPPSATAEAPLTVRVVAPNGRGIAGVDLVVGFDTGATVEDYTQEHGWSLPADERRTPRWIRFAVPMHGIASDRFPIDLAAGNAIVFTLTPNDLGVADFDAEPLDIAPGQLLMRRDGATLVYQRID